MNDTIFNEIVAFVYEERWKYKKELERNTTLEDDLKITGDDGDDFMEAFFDRFNVEMRQFDIGKFFADEGFTLINFAYLFGKKKKRYHPKPLTLGHLEKVVKLGYWIDP